MAGTRLTNRVEYTDYQVYTLIVSRRKDQPQQVSLRLVNGNRRLNQEFTSGSVLAVLDMAEKTLRRLENDLEKSIRAADMRDYFARAKSAQASQDSGEQHQATTRAKVA